MVAGQVVTWPALWRGLQIEIELLSDTPRLDAIKVPDGLYFGHGVADSFLDFLINQFLQKFEEGTHVTDTSAGGASILNGFGPTHQHGFDDTVDDVRGLRWQNLAFARTRFHSLNSGSGILGQILQTALGQLLNESLSFTCDVRADTALGGGCFNHVFVIDGVSAWTRWIGGEGSTKSGVSSDYAWERKEKRRLDRNAQR